MSSDHAIAQFTRTEHVERRSYLIRKRVFNESLLSIFL